MYKLKENKGRISMIEMVALVFLVPMLLFLAYNGIHWYYDSITNGNDGMYVNTAESVAMVNSLNGLQCPVDGCSHGENCGHKKGDYYVGYFDSISHKIVADPMEGYNQASTLHIKDRKYYGQPGTMIIEVICKDSSVELNWVLGK